MSSISPTLTGAPQSYIVGATVHCELRIGQQGGTQPGAPIDPTTVTVASITLLPSTTIAIPPIVEWPADPTFRPELGTWTGIVVTHLATGLWAFDIPSIGWAPGSYRLTFFLSSGPTATALPSTVVVVTAN